MPGAGYSTAKALETPDTNRDLPPIPAGPTTGLAASDLRARNLERI